MYIKVLASSSKGNCYTVSDEYTTLMIECGIPIRRIKQELSFRLFKTAGCLITHEHKDHCKAVNDILKVGINVYMSHGTMEALGATGHRLNIVKAKQKINIGTMSILPFSIQHDAAEPLGFLVRSMKTKEKLLYLTDSYYSRYVFPGLNYIMIECNYAKDILDANLESGKVHPTHAKRLLQSHFSLENVKDFLKANDLDRVKEIYLMHLSDRNSDAERFKTEIQELTGKPVYICGE